MIKGFLQRMEEMLFLENSQKERWKGFYAQRLHHGDLRVPWLDIGIYNNVNTAEINIFIRYDRV